MIDLSRESRKIEHVKLALKQQTSTKSAFDDLILLHNPITELNYSNLSLDSKIGELHISSPIFINAMTGGAHDTSRINQELAIVAKHFNLPMAVGSQMAAIKNPDLIHTYSIVRQENPDGIIIANLGQEATLEQAKRAIDMINANALQIHLNVMQELIMPEGDRDFSGTLKRIAIIAEKIRIPLIIKEVGFGMPLEAVKKLKEIGVRIIDVGGKGGTNFAKIENQRSNNRFSILNNWGISTPVSILEAQGVKGMQIIGSGGVKNGLDVVKALSIGASLVGMAGSFLHKLHSSGLEGLVSFVEELHDQIRLIMVATGAKDLQTVQKIPVIIRGETKEWCTLRGIDINEFARRDIN